MFSLKFVSFLWFALSYTLLLVSIDGWDFGCLPTQNKLNKCNVDVDVGHKH